MKKNIYKVLGVVLTMAIVLTTCLCAFTAAHADVTEGDIIYPTFLQGNILEKDGAVQIQPENGGRVYTKTMYKVADFEKVVVAAPYQANFWFYDAEGNYVKKTGFVANAEVKIASSAGNAAQFRVVLKDTTNDNVCTATKLASDVVALYKAAQDVTVDGVTTPVMMQGNIFKDNNTGELVVQTTSTERICTVNTYNVADYSKLVIAAGFRANIVFLNAEGGYVSNHAWKTGTVDIASLAGDAPKFRVVVAADPNLNPFTPDMLPAGAIALVKGSGKAPEDVVIDNVVYPVMKSGNVYQDDKGAFIVQASNPERILTVNKYNVADFEKAIIASGYRVCFVSYDADGNVTGKSGWLTGEINIAAQANGAPLFGLCAAADPNLNPFTPDMLPADAIALVKGSGEVPHEHLFENYVYNNDATCTANGTETATCACGEKDTREAANTMVAHTFENYVYNEDATCQANGTATGKCACGLENTIEAADTKLAHFYNTEYDIDCNNCGEVREAPEKAENSEVKDGVLYIDGMTSIKGMFKVGEDYYFADWGGAIKTGKIYVKSSYCDLPGGKEYTFGEDGKLLDGIVDGVLYIKGITASKGIYEIDGAYYFADWGGAIKTDGKYYTSYIYVEGLVAGEYAFGADGKMLDGIVEKDGAQYIYLKGVTVGPGEYEIDGVLYKATWGGLVVAE